MMTQNDTIVWSLFP